MRFRLGIRLLETGSRDHAYFILANNLFIFCLCSKLLCEVKFKGGELINLAEEVSRKPNTQTGMDTCGCF